MDTRPSPMTAIITPHDPLANQINAEHAAVRKAVRDALVHALKCGDLLLEAKGKSGHGAWQNWLEKHCGEISYRTAALYMQLAKHRDEIEAKSATVAHLTLNEAVKLIGPEPSPSRIVKGKAYVDAVTPLNSRGPIPVVKEEKLYMEGGRVLKESEVTEHIDETPDYSAMNDACKEGEAQINNAKIQLDAHKADLIDAIEENKRDAWKAMQVRLYLEKELCKHLTPEEQKVRWFQALGLYWALFCCFLEDASPGAIQMYDLHKGILKRVVQACEAAETEAPPAMETPTPTEAPAPAETAATPAPDAPAPEKAKQPSLAERKRAIAAADAELAERVESGEITLKAAEQELAERVAV